MSVIGGKYINLFDAMKEYPVDTSIKYDVRDYGGFVKSPVGNTFSDKFVLFSILCQINFIICCVDSWVREEVSTKMRFAYLLYYSLLILSGFTIGLFISMRRGGTKITVCCRKEGIRNPGWRFLPALSEKTEGFRIENSPLLDQEADIAFKNRKVIFTNRTSQQMRVNSCLVKPGTAIEAEI